MISADNKEFKVGDVVFNRWGEAEKVTSASHCKDAVYTSRINGPHIGHVAANTLYVSQKAALEHHVAWVARQAFEAEQQAVNFREQEKEIRRLITVIEKEEEQARRLAEIPDEMPIDD